MGRVFADILENLAPDGHLGRRKKPKPLTGTDVCDARVSPKTGEPGAPNAGGNVDVTKARQPKEAAPKDVANRSTPVSFS